MSSDGRIPGGRSDADVFREVYYELYNRRNHKRLGRVHYPRYDGGRSETGRYYKPVWPKCAEKLTSKGLDVRAYLENIMNRYDVHSPSEAVRDEYIEEYASVLADNDSVKVRWDLEERVLSDAYDRRLFLGDDPVIALTRVLRDPSLAVSPLVRYACGVLNGRQDLVERYAAEAYGQYLSMRVAYDRWCESRIPEKWRKCE